MEFLSTENGTFAHELPEIPPKKHIPIFCSMNDLYYKDFFCLLRLLNEPFIECLKYTYKSLYRGQEMKIQEYGKPHLLQFQYAQQHSKLFLKNNLEASNFYMIGDNTKSYVKRANQIGWNSILIRTGVFNGVKNDHTYPAKYVVEDFQDAVKLIFKLEGIGFSGSWPSDSKELNSLF